MTPTPAREAAGRPDAPPRLRHNPYLWAFLSGIAVLTLIRPLLRYEPAPPPVLFQVPPFSLVSSAGRPFGSADLAGRPYVAGLCTTRCASTCPLLIQAMGRLAQRFDEAGVPGVRLVLITADPDHDTPAVLADYARVGGLDARRLTLLTGDRGRIDRLARGFKLTLDALDGRGGHVDASHLNRLLLVDGAGGFRGYYGSDELGQDEVFHRSRHVIKAQGVNAP